MEVLFLVIGALALGLVIGSVRILRGRGPARRGVSRASGSHGDVAGLWWLHAAHANGGEHRHHSAHGHDAPHHGSDTGDAGGGDGGGAGGDGGGAGGDGGGGGGDGGGGGGGGGD